MTLNLTEESAESEPAWKGIGQKPGLQIWRIVVSLIAYRWKGIGQKQVCKTVWKGFVQKPLLQFNFNSNLEKFGMSVECFE